MVFTPKNPMESRLNMVNVKRQVRQLVKEEHAEHWIAHIQHEFVNMPVPVLNKPRFFDNILPEHIKDGKPVRILLSQYWEWGDHALVSVGINYGVFVPNKVVELFGGHERIARFIAMKGLEGLKEWLFNLPAHQKTGIRVDLVLLQIEIENREQLED